MTWYAAHIVTGIIPIQESPGPIVVHENVVLVEAPSEVDAMGKAKAIGQTETALQDGLSLDGVLAKGFYPDITDG